MVRCAICGVLVAALFAWNLKSYGRRIKEGKLGGSIIASIAHAIKELWMHQKNHSEFLSCTESKQTASDRLYSIAWRTDNFYVDHLCIRFSLCGRNGIFLLPSDDII